MIRPVGLWFVCVLTASAAAGQDSVPPRNLPVLQNKQAMRLVVKREPPAYPVVARVNYIQGEVSLEAVVTADGRVSEAHVTEGHPLLAAAALEAVRKWVFRPAHSRPGPAEFIAFMKMKFALRTGKLRSFPSKPAEDLERRVRPPEVAEIPGAGAAARSVRLRVLVSPEGRMMDSLLLTGGAGHFALARKVIERCTFRPARWGALAVPWYLDLDVPVGESPTAQNRPVPGEG